MRYVHASELSRRVIRAIMLCHLSRIAHDRAMARKAIGSAS